MSPENPQLGRIEAALAIIDVYTGHFAAAFARLESILRSPSLQWNARDRRRLDTERWLAGCQVETGMTKEGLTLARATLDTQLATYGPKDARTPLFRATYGLALARAGNSEEAAGVLVEAARGFEAAHSENPRLAFHMVYVVASVWNDLRRPGDAEQLLRKYLDRCQALVGELHPLTLDMKIELGRALAGDGRESEARAVLDAVLTQLDSVNGNVEVLEARARSILGR
jgi:tetratricopeptide (TPR) repeat protein